MSMDKASGTYSVLSASIDDKSRVKRVTEFADFYDIAASWVDMIGGSDCMIIQNEKDKERIRSINPVWYQTFGEAGVDSFVLFPLRHNDEVLGFIWATNYDITNTMRIKETLELTTYFISSQMAGYRMMERLKQMSYTDVLTSLPNRFACCELLDELIRMRKPFTLVIMDLNSFKSINDTLGFQAGNKALVEIASRWKNIADTGAAGTHDYIARLGGDEFALVIRDYNSSDYVSNTIQMYEKALNKRLTVDDCDFYINASFGYTSYPEDSENSDSLLTYAAASMKEIKRAASSNHILRFTPDLLKHERTIEVEKIIREALDNDTIFFNLQPQYDMEHKLRGFEALARMKDSKGNNISPAEFIPVAEKVGLIDKVDGTVYRKAALFFGELLRKTGSDLVLSINVSVRHLMKNDFFDEIMKVIAISGISADKLEIEITESIMIDSAEKALNCIDRIKEMGIKIAIDDFGTGYSALSYLNSFPADILKIDKSFIDKMNEGESFRQYVAAIISMGHIMGFEVVSEGVESEDQVEILRNIGCDFIQGFVWGRPLSPEDAEKTALKDAAERQKL
ncbi:MAG: bifunctional diguanylate cyclase/phosphodiesterase [Ruminococcus sp.]|nr:bifunctional diguanylate cyclase/phosphodiesterase [Ruminococcus sp.]